MSEANICKVSVCIRRISLGSHNKSRSLRLRDATEKEEVGGIKRTCRCTVFIRKSAELCYPRRLSFRFCKYLKVGNLDKDTLGGSSGVGDVDMTTLGIDTVMNVSAEWSPEASQVHL